VAPSTQRILLADDDAAFRTAMKTLLEREGYVVVEAANGEEALERCRTASFDLVVTDLSMPRQDGMRLVDGIKALAQRMPVIVITAFGEWDTYAEAIGKGVIAYLDKPVKKDEVLASVRAALRVRQT
jgi:DNA-binding NtrC family response regulator